MKKNALIGVKLIKHIANPNSKRMASHFNHQKMISMQILKGHFVNNIP